MKVKAKELRIGNLIYFQAEPYVPEFSELEVFKLSKNRVNGKHQSCFKVIPLTGEWLEKFGFEKSGAVYNLGYSIEFSIKKWNGKDGTDWVIFQGHRNVFYKGEFYVHQLQNLYFCLTKTELTLNTQSNETSKTKQGNIGV
jgi:hypothetical protein